MRPNAFGWIDYEVSTAPEWDRAQMTRFARHLGYRIVWPAEHSVLPVAEQVRNAGAEVVILPAPDHLGPLELNRVMNLADVEVILPRIMHGSWAGEGDVRLGLQP
ncbi:hypothetical protein [Nocardia cyriacigeorgica]|uniref:hypothetical protein n=1 Tax=Nocardia cyriacigeorgica TaxID=135487 RepID=UPI001893F1CE|nr:hypothetical protein [Nocardia cyriacigeorgica]MBF6456439.1 hypothetical protein [Nocardia cyriacigeorgica]MBF6479385.1 hypothetical protein [Nocardia cyriacigeorgica]MBF6551245.1 hypothetical protein [Nocardia cyriacigeorgica]